MRHDHAVVLGGSIAGLLAAVALSEPFDRVTILDRDDLAAAGEEMRRGVPQGSQVHHLLALGAERLEQLLPGIDDDLRAAGCEVHDNLAEFAQWSGSSWRMRVPSDLHLVCFTRPLFESVIRQRVLALPNVETMKGMASGLRFSDDGGTVNGVRCAKAPDGVLGADFVVDASGRGSKAASWIEDAGFARPAVEQLRVHMGYTSARVRLAPDALPEGVVSVSGSGKPGSTQSIVLWPCGRGEHMVVGFGALREYPPKDWAGLQQLADELPVTAIANAMRTATVLSDPVAYQMVGDQRVRWEELPSRPERFVVVGDAVASYNPAYGQGMTMAAVAAVQLRTELLAAEAELDGVASSFQQHLSGLVDLAWNNALSFDLRFPGAEQDNLVALPPQPDADVSRALNDLQAVDPAVALATRRATHWLQPELLEEEEIQEKVRTWVAGKNVVPAELSDPTRIPSIAAA